MNNISISFISPHTPLKVEIKIDITYVRLDNKQTFSKNLEDDRTIYCYNYYFARAGTYLVLKI